MTSFGFQLYSVHAIDDPLPAVVERVGQTGFDGVELAGLGGADVEAVGDALETTGLEPAGAHVDIEELEADAGGVAETYGALGCENVVVPWFDPEAFEDEQSVEEAGARLDAVAEDLAKYGVSLHYHNHDQEFADLDGEPALTRLMDVTDDVSFELDLGWVGAAGCDPLSYLDDHADRVRLVHLKDYDAEAGELVDVGDGDIDVEAAVSAVRDHGLDWVLYEAEGRPGSYETLSRAADAVETYW
jgi:sugar phosphate isomerase/epimerase